MPGRSQLQSQTNKITAFGAVVIADSFSDDFKPVTIEMPRCLLPVAGVPLIDYTMEHLIGNGVEEIFVLSCAHSDMVKAYVDKVWGKRGDVKVEVLPALGCESLGDAIRRLRSADVLRSDFILCAGDMISNVSNLREVWEQHNKRRDVDPAVVMTMFLKEDTTAAVTARNAAMKQSIQLEHARRSVEGADDSSSEREKDKDAPASTVVGTTDVVRKAKMQGVIGEERVTAVVDPTTSNLLQYVGWRGENSDTLNLSLELLTECPTLQIRNDLTETGMAVCSLQLLSMFEEQGFDYTTMRDCVKSVINDGLLGNKIMTELVPAQKFLRRVRTLEQYHNITKAVIEGWAYPYLVDAPFTARHHTLDCRQRSVFVDRSSSLSHTCKTGRTVVVGPNVVVGEHALLVHSTLGSGVKVGKNTTVSGCQVWEGAVIGNNCTLEGAVVCKGAVVGNNCKLAPGSVISFGVSIADGTEIASGQRITKVKEPELGDLDEAISSEIQYIDASEEDIVGSGGVGRAFSMAPELDLDEHGLSLPYEPNLSSAASVFYISVDDVADPDKPLTNDEHFLNEVTEIIKRAVLEKIRFDDVAIELNTAKFSYNASVLDYCCAVLVGLLQRADEKTSGSKRCVRNAFSNILDKWRGLFDRYHSTSVEEEFLRTLIMYAKTSPPVCAKVGGFLHALFDESLLSEATIRNWEQEKRKEQRARTIDRQEDAMLATCDSLLLFLDGSSEEEDSDE